MSNPALLWLPLRSGLDGRDRNGVVTATASGPVRFTADGYFAEEGTTNLVGNPTFAVNATGWTGATRDTGYAYLGPASGLIAATGASAEATYSLTVPASQHTLSAVVRNNAAAARSFQLRYNGANVGSAVVVAAGAVTRLSGQITGTGGAAAAGVRITDSANGETFSVGHLQVEAKAYATSPCPAMDASGAISTGYSWAGIAHASASTRQAAWLSLEDAGRILPAQGAIVMRYRLDQTPVNNSNLVGVGRLGESGKDHLELRLGSGGTTLQVMWSASGSPSTSATKTGIALGADLLAYTDWSGTTINCGVIGSALVTGSRDPVVGDMDTAANMGIGAYPNGSGAANINNPIRDLMIFDRPLTTTERDTLAATPEWSFGVLQPRIGGLLRIGMGMGLAMSHAVLASDPIALLRGGGGE